MSLARHDYFSTPRMGLSYGCQPVLFSSYMVLCHSHKSDPYNKLMWVPSYEGASFKDSHPPRKMVTFLLIYCRRVGVILNDIEG